MEHITKNDKLFFDLYEKAVDGDKKAKEMVRIALQAFNARPRVMVKKSMQAFQRIQATGVSTDFAKLISDAYSVTIEMDNFDLGYQRAFKDVPLGQNQDTWDIYNVSNGLTFNLVPEGKRIKIDELNGSLVTAHVDYFGGALGWTDKMIRYRKIAAMLDMASIFRNKFWSNKADNHYLLLAAAAVGNVTLYPAGSSQLRQDIAALNNAAYALTNRNKDKGYGDMANASLILYANPINKGRILAALAATTQYMQMAAGEAAATIQWNIAPLWTFNSNILANKPLLVLPGNKIQAAEDMAPTTFNAPKDVLTLNEVQAVWSIYGAAVADTDQIQTVNLA